jgi:hypothetical protein
MGDASASHKSKVPWNRIWLLFIYLKFQWIHYRPVSPFGYGTCQNVQKHTDYYDTYIRQQKHILVSFDYPNLP